MVAMGRFPQTCVKVMFMMELQSRSKMVVCAYSCTSANTLELIFRNINDILHFGVLFVICLFLLVAHFVSYLLFRILISLFYCFNPIAYRGGGDF